MVVLLGMLFVAILGSLLLRPRPPRAQPNVLWITVDSLRPDHLGCYGYERAHSPNIDAYIIIVRPIWLTPGVQRVFETIQPPQLLMVVLVHVPQC